MSISGSPAATSEPNASTRIASVTGQLNSSDFIIAVRFAVLKSHHIPEAPVSETVTPEAPAACSFDFSSSATATIAVGSPFAPAITIAVWPSAEIVAPARGATTVATFGVRVEHLRDAGDRRLERGVGRGLAGRVDDDHQRRAREPAEVLLDQLPRLHRLRAVRLPARAGERGLDLRREERRTPTAITTQAIATARK